MQPVDIFELKKEIAGINNFIVEETVQNSISMIQDKGKDINWTNDSLTMLNDQLH
jgi:hypothetical protein